jgi:hypothetical protein
MAAPMNMCTRIEQRGIVLFLLAKDMASKNIYKEMLPMYGEHCVSRLKHHHSEERFPDYDTVERAVCAWF